MAKMTEMDVKDLVYSLLKDAGVGSEISGRIYKDEPRPTNSELEDVEISVLQSDMSQNQLFYVNVNVFVKDVVRGDDMVGDSRRLDALSDIFLQALEYTSGKGMTVRLESQRVMDVPEADLHVISNSVEIKYNSEN